MLMGTEPSLSEAMRRLATPQQSVERQAQRAKNLSQTNDFWLMGTPVAPLAGTVEVTAGEGDVLKVHTKLAASAVPAVSFAPVVIVAVYKVAAARGAPGVKVAVFPT